MDYFLESTPIGTDENKQLFKILTSHIVYYGLNELSADQVNTYLRKISQHCNI